jgi:hypothetical protein
VPRKTLPAAPPGPLPHIVHPHAVYDMPQARAALGLSKGTLSREVRLGRLRVSVRAGKRFFLGSWLLQWIESGELHRPAANGHAANGHPVATSAAPDPPPKPDKPEAK